MKKQSTKLLSYQEAYKKAVNEISMYGSMVGDSKELIDYKFEFDAKTPPITRDKSEKYADDEFYLYFTATNKTSEFEKASKIWSKLSDSESTREDRQTNSAYGYIIREKFGYDQFEMAFKELYKNNDSRRATIKINTPLINYVDGHKKNLVETNDEYCTMYLQFLIRDNELILISNMRSNDMYFGTPYDLEYFNSLGKIMGIMLRKDFTKHIHQVSSLHIYEKDFEKFNKEFGVEL